MTLSSRTEILSETTHPATDPHTSHITNRLNWLRAGVLGANDGIVSTAGLVVGVAAATTNSWVIFTAGLAGLVAGGVSMALGEYVSVSTQRDTQRALLQKERQEPDEMPEAELGIDPGDLSNPWQAALSSAVAFTLGAVVPLFAILLPPVGARVPVAFLSVLIALVLTGTVSAMLGGARKRRAVVRVVLGGVLAMLVTYGIGQMVGTTI
jgi:VIT1/CCC1 family predicted Fe2+/Mn2+ transporter